MAEKELLKRQDEMLRGINLIVAKVGKTIDEFYGSFKYGYVDDEEVVVCFDENLLNKVCESAHDFYYALKGLKFWNELNEEDKISLLDDYNKFKDTIKPICDLIGKNKKE